MSVSDCTFESPSFLRYTLYAPEGIHGVDQQGGLCHPSLRKAKCSKKPSQAILCGRLGGGVCEVDGVACCCFVHADLVFV